MNAILLQLKKPETENETSTWPSVLAAVSKIQPTGSRLTCQGGGLLLIENENAFPLLGPILISLQNADYPYRVTFIEKSFSWDCGFAKPDALC